MRETGHTGKRLTIPAAGEAWTGAKHRLETTAEAGEVSVGTTAIGPLGAPLSARVMARWRMADITENTRVAIKVGSIAGAIIMLLTVGAWWGGLQSERQSTRDDRVMQRARDDRQDEAIQKLQDAITGVNTNLALLKQGQDAALPQLIRQSTYNTELMRDLQTALATRGIRVKEE